MPKRTNIPQDARDSFVFYRSFYEGIKCMPSDIQLEIYRTITEYALFSIEPDGISDPALGMFTLIRPSIDANNKRWSNGRKGGEYGKRGGRPKKNAKPAATADAPDTPTDIPAPATPCGAQGATPGVTGPDRASGPSTLEQEFTALRTDTAWLKAAAILRNIPLDEITSAFDRFQAHCLESREGRPHDSLDDAKRHFRYWFDKQPGKTSPDKTSDPQPAPPADYTFNGGFGGMDT